MARKNNEIGQFQIGRWNVNVNAATGDVYSWIDFYKIDNNEYKFVCSSNRVWDGLHIYDTSDMQSSERTHQTPQQVSEISKNIGLEVPIEAIREWTDLFLENYYSKLKQKTLKPWQEV